MLPKKGSMQTNCTQVKGYESWNLQVKVRLKSIEYHKKVNVNGFLYISFNYLKHFQR